MAAHFNKDGSADLTSDVDPDRTLHLDPGYDEADYIAFFAADVPVPETLNKIQVQLGLKAAGKLAAFKAIIASLPDDDDNLLRWQGASEINRHHPTTIAFGAALGLDAAALDALFVAAKALT